MTSLQRMALKEIKDISKKLDNNCCTVGNDIRENKEFNDEKHSYPLAQEARRITWWAVAILESEKDETD